MRAYRRLDGRRLRYEQVLELRTQGLTNQEIAERLGITAWAVEASLQGALRRNPKARRLAQMRRYSMQRRAARKANEWCVNHDNRPATHGCRCADCHVTHRGVEITTTGTNTNG